MLFALVARTRCSLDRLLVGLGPLLRHRCLHAVCWLPLPLVENMRRGWQVVLPPRCLLAPGSDGLVSAKLTAFGVRDAVLRVGN